MSKELWVKQGNGPDWIDVGIYFMELEKLHECELSLIISRATTGASSALLVSLLATSAQLTEGMSQKRIALKHLWPTGQHKTMEGLVFKLLHELDAACCREWWKQKELT